MKKFLVWLFCLILLTQPVFAQSEKLIILNTNTGQDTDTGTGQNGKCGHIRTVCSFNGSIYRTGDL